MYESSSLIFKVVILLLKYNRSTMVVGFPDSSVGKEPTCNAGDSGTIPGSGRSRGEGIDYPFQCSWASLVAQLVKNLPAMQGTPVQSLGRENPLEKEKATHSHILTWRIPWTIYIVHGVATSWTQLSDFHINSFLLRKNSSSLQPM